MNIPARFVSGYLAEPDGSHDRQLHAWAEVYLPGAGWRGFDPTLGLAITDRHLAVAAGRTPANAAPIAGAFRGAVESQMTVGIEMHINVEGERIGAKTGKC
jgi:transglutaminase-like putative cysteine protease